MKLHYDKDTDSLYIDVANGVSADSREMADGFVVDYDADGRIVGFDIQYASQQLDLSRIETSNLPPATASRRDPC